jgi:putative hemolysin
MGVCFNLIQSVVLLIILILLSGILSSSEIALSASNRNKVKMLADKGDKRAARLLANIDEPHNFFATTQLYITFIAFFCGAYAASSFTDPLVGLIRRLNPPISDNVIEPLVFILITVFLTYVALVFGELVPKRIAMQYAIPFSLRTLPFLRVLSILALPFVKVLSASTKLVLKLMRFKDECSEEGATKDEIRMIVESSGEHGFIAEDEQNMIENIFSIDKLTAGEICTHRLDIDALPIDADYNTVLEMMTGEYFTRVPVYEENLDNICGILYTKDVIRYIANNQNPSAFDIKTLIRKVHFIPLSKKIDELFREMRKERVSMAVVLDEYGGTLGIVTLEDLIEKIVGSIHDEYDADEQPDIIKLNGNTFRVLGSIALEAVQSQFGILLPTEEYDTLSGFLVGQIGHIPAEDEKPEISWEGVLFKVESLNDKRIATVLVTKQAEQPTER